MKNRIAELRKNEGISQAELAAVLGISRELLSRIENGKCDCSLALADKVARHFMLPLYDVFELASRVDYDFALKMKARETKDDVLDSVARYAASMISDPLDDF